MRVNVATGFASYQQAPRSGSAGGSAQPAKTTTQASGYQGAASQGGTTPRL